jgi:hypothetical protein
MSASGPHGGLTDLTGSNHNDNVPHVALAYLPTIFNNGSG